MLAEESANEGDESKTDSSAQHTRSSTQFNPMSNYFAIVAGIVISYILFFVFGYPALIIAVLFFVVQVVRETVEILDKKAGGFLRKAAYFNAGLTLVCFGILAINGYVIFRGSTPPILPEIANLTLLSPLLILTALYGSKNIKGMIDAQGDSKE